MSDFRIRPVDSDDGDWIEQFITERWGAEFVAAHGQVYFCRNLPGFVLVKINRNAIEFTRSLKPVPLIGAEGIPLRDEIELEMILGE